MAETAARRAHLNLVESSRRLFELDPGAEIEAGEGWLFGAGSADHPTISNAAFRLDDELEPGELLSRAREFFGERGRGFAVWARGGVAEDADLISAAEAAGLQNVYEMPEMTLAGRPEALPLADGVELRRLDSAEDAEHYWRIAAAAYATSASRRRSSASTAGWRSSRRRAATPPPSSPTSTAPRSRSR